MTEKYYKVTDADGRSYNGGDCRWPLPGEDGTPGEWTPEVEGDLEPCENGYHLCRRADLVRWLGEAVWEAEPAGEVVEADDKVVCRSARLLRRLTAWDERATRLFACDCAERVLPLLERARPGDARPREAIAVARRYAAGEATAEELEAAGYAARYAAGSAVWYPAGYPTGYAVLYAVWYAAGSAARYAAGYAAERRWQTERLFDYLEGRA